MSNSIANKILRRIRAKRRGWVFTAKDFVDICPRNTIDQVLLRLVQRDVIRKLSRGLYDFPLTHQSFGKILPNPDKIARTMAAQTDDAVYPSGATCANLLGLSTQIPAKPVYLTSGSSKRKIVGNNLLILKHTNLVSADVSYKVNMTVHALLYIGKNHVDQQVVRQCIKNLSTKDKKQLKKIVKKLPGWIVPIINKISA